MPIHLLERAVLFTAAAAVLGVLGAVGALSVLPPLSSGVPDVAVEAELATLDWLDAERRARHGARLPAPEILADTTAVFTADRGRHPRDERPRDQTSPAPRRYFRSATDAPLAPGEVIEGFPWLVKAPNLTYHRPRRVPRILYRKLQSLEAGLEFAQRGGGEFVTTTAGEPAYQVEWVDPNGLLAGRIGLRAGDRIVSINGYPVGDSVAAGQQLYALLKTETRFAVLIERAGAQQVLSFYVD